MRGSWIAWTIAAAGIGALTYRLVRPPDGTDDGLGPWRLGARRFRRNAGARVALVAIVALFSSAALAPWLAPHDPDRQPDVIAMRTLPPSPAHLMGTDPASRDVFSRVLHGARVSLSIGLLAVLLSVTVGTLYGAIAGFTGGLVDAVMMRIIDAFLSIPRILLLLIVVALWGQLSVIALVFLIGMTGWFGVSRVVRAQVMGVATREFVVSARALGAGSFRVLRRHILPNVLSPVIVAATLGIGNVIVLEAGLSYLGLGVQPPQSSWGSIIREGMSDLSAHWWMTFFPGLAIVLTVMAFNAVGEGLRDALDPR